MATISPKGGDVSDAVSFISPVEKDMTSPSPLHPDSQTSQSTFGESASGKAVDGKQDAAGSTVSAEIAILASSIEANAARLETVQDENRQNVLLACSRLNELSDLEARVKRDLVRVEALPGIIERNQQELRDLVNSRDAFIKQLKEELGDEEGNRDGDGIPAHLQVTDFSRLLALEPPRDQLQPISMPSGKYSSVEALEASAPESVKANLVRIDEAMQFGGGAGGPAAVTGAGEGSAGAAGGAIGGGGEGVEASSRDRAGRTAGSHPKLSLSSPGREPLAGGSFSSLAPQTPSSARRSRSISRTDSARQLELSKGRFLDVDQARKESDNLKAKLAKALQEQEDLGRFLSEAQVVEGNLQRLAAQADKKEDILAPILEELSDAVETARTENKAAEVELEKLQESGEGKSKKANEAEWSEALKKADVQKEIAVAGLITTAAVAGTADREEASFVAGQAGIDRAGGNTGGAPVNPALDALSPKTVVSEMLPTEISSGIVSDENMPPAPVEGSAAGTHGAAMRLPSGQEPIEAREIPVDTDNIPDSPPIGQLVQEKKSEMMTPGYEGAPATTTTAATVPPSLAAPAPRQTEATEGVTAGGVPSVVLPPLAAPPAAIPVAIASTAPAPAIVAATATSVPETAAPSQQPAVVATHPHPDLRIDTAQANADVPVVVSQEVQQQPHHPPGAGGQVPIAQEYPQNGCDRCIDRFCSIQ